MLKSYKLVTTTPQKITVVKGEGTNTKKGDRDIS